MKEIIIYTDGACSGNPGPGGWGAVLYYKDQVKTIFGSNIQTTNNQMELTAAIKSLELLKERCLVTIYTDSVYVKDGITKWLPNWKIKNWKTANNKPVKNIELWQELDNLVNKHSVSWKWVKGHSGDRGNELADQLAVRGRDEAMGIKIN